MYLWFLLLREILIAVQMFYSFTGNSHEIHFLIILKKISRDSVVTDSESYNGFPQINLPFKFSRINHRPPVIKDDCSNRCEINNVSLTKWITSSAPMN